MRIDQGEDYQSSKISDSILRLHSGYVWFETIYFTQAHKDTNNLDPALNYHYPHEIEHHHHKISLLTHI